jgi:stage III sporulation protein SpoIIIAA
LAEASAQVQVIATSHGTDLVDRLTKPSGHDASALYAVDRVNGLTAISSMRQGKRRRRARTRLSRSEGADQSPHT